MAQPIRIPEGFVDELKARIRPSDVIGRKVKLKKQGKEFVGLSPFTSEKSPSFFVNDQKRIFKCFSSGIGGDVISFVMETERLGFMEAVEKLAEEAGMELPKATPEAQEKYDYNQRLREVCEAAAAFFEAQLHDTVGAEARRYLEGRGLGPEAWKRHRLGFSPDAWRATADHLKGKGFTEGEIIDAGLSIKKDAASDPYDRFRGRVMFPIPDSRGNIIAFGGRGMAPDAKPKYLNSNETPLFHKGRALYRYKAAREALGHGEGGGLIICEGYMDAIALTEAGFGNAVAPLGTALTEEQLSLIWRAGPEPILCFDGDAAGLRAAYRAIDRALPHVEPGRSLYFALLPDGMDPDDLIEARGAGAMQDVLNASLPLSEVLWRRERDHEPVDTPERKAGLDQRLKAACAVINNQAVRTAYERDLRQRMNDHFWDIRRAKRDSGSSGGGDRGRQGQSKSWSGGAPTMAGQALKAGLPAQVKGMGYIIRAIDNPHLVDIGGEELAHADFPDSDVCALRDGLFDLIDAGIAVDREALRTNMESAGHIRAAKMLSDYPDTPTISPDGPEAREWLIALEQYAAVDGSEQAGMDAARADATESPAAWRRLHQRIAERRALRVRVNEAAEKTGES